jgi:undecaprenyl-diphosphatase
MNNKMLIAVGFVSSFVFGWIVVNRFLDDASRRGFALFAWWRIVVGVAGRIGLALRK